MRVFITGITGTLGTELALQHAALGHEVHGCARSELRSKEWYENYRTIAKFYLGDAYSLFTENQEVCKILRGCDRVYHCAAMKHVDQCERHPLEATCQNITVLSACLSVCKEHDVPFTFISSDKACMPTGVYGATKLLGEKLILARQETVVRLGNLVGSSGSVFQMWRYLLERGCKIKVTDPGMTRYFITVTRAARYVIGSTVPGLHVPLDMKSARMGDLAEHMVGKNYEVVGSRPGETRHQWLACQDETVIARPVMEPTILDEGLHSYTARRWDVVELLQEAGVMSCGR